MFTLAVYYPDCRTVITQTFYLCYVLSVLKTYHDFIYFLLSVRLSVCPGLVSFDLEMLNPHVSIIGCKLIFISEIPS